MEGILKVTAILVIGAWALIWVMVALVLQD
jgi:hypothetical protein